MRMPAQTLAVVAVVAGAFLAGSWHTRRQMHGNPSAQARRILYWVCPMHPQFKSDKPGNAPCCGMRLEPVYDRDSGNDPGSPSPPGIPVEAQGPLTTGVRTVRVEHGTFTRTIRTVGRVAADENRVYRLNTSTEVWIRSLHPPTAGSMVRKDEPLVEFYTTNFYSAAAAYLYALNTRDRQMKASPNNDTQVNASKFQERQAVESLQNLGVSDPDIKEMERTRRAPNLVTLRSPADGYVLARNIGLGQWVASATELYRIADLKSVWVLADIFENEARLIKPGQSATVTYEGGAWRARMSDVLPQFDPASRTLKVRFEVDNPSYTLRPDMFVDVDYPVHVQGAISVPTDSVIDSGLRKIVYVENADGAYEPRQVETGWRLGDRVVIAKGLEPGERVVVSGTFLIDSESRMKLASVSTAAKTKDPVCGMEVDPAKALKSEYRNKTYYFCSETCKREFEKNPQRFLLNKAGGAGHKLDPES